MKNSPTKNKLPSLQWYPGDWRKDIAVQSLSFHDRGVWFEMLMIMHDSEDRGKMVLNGHPMSDDMIARAIGLDNQNFNQTLTTLLTSGVAERDEVTGAIFNRRMVRDERLRIIRVQSGSKGGNPVLLNQKSTTPVNQNPTPSSSSSSSIPKKKKKPSRKRATKPPKPTEPDHPKLPLTKTAQAKARHAEFKELVRGYWNSKNTCDMPWDGSEGSQLDMFLRASPDLTAEQFTAMLRNRYRSDVNHGDRPSLWIRYLTSYGITPIDRFNKPAAGAKEAIEREIRAAKGNPGDCDICHNMRMVIVVNENGDRVSKDCECRTLWRQNSHLT